MRSTIILTLLVLTTCIAVSQQQPDCLNSDMYCDEPCHYRRKLMEAGDNNEYTIHYTKLKGRSCRKCCIRPNKQRNGTITTVGTENTKIIYSPGFILNKPYSNHLLVQYKIYCGKGRLAFFNVTDISLQGTTSNSSWCYDFIRINRGRAGTTEICDRIGSSNFLLQLESSSFSVTFRTSAEGEYPGFQMYIVCFEHQYHAVDRGKRCCNKHPPGLEPITHEDIPGFPLQLKIRDDLAKFHNMWRTQRKRPIKRIVSYSESVIYLNKTIHIVDSNQTEIARYENIVSLRTFNGEGKTNIYTHNQIFPGPGPLIMIRCQGFFQLFLIDPQGLIPTPDEQEDLNKMNEVLFDAIPDSADAALIITEEVFSGDGNNSDIHNLQRRSTPGGCSDDIWFLALKYKEGPNPIMRQQALSLIEVLKGREQNDYFTFNCLFRESMLCCTVDDSSCPTENNAAYCTTNTSGCEMCDPFHGTVIFDASVTSVAVEAINCNGQKAVKMFENTPATSG